jgi:hypothetical protein
VISSQSRHSARTVRIQRSAEALALGLYRRDQYLGAVRTEDVVEGAGELRLPIAN